ncbi:methyltransferase (plasmid) [Streptomyces jietaisiensis]|uniref:methyltransferase n=1 Tax=Streptomyces griseoaurantiacus TaxID=68213 RepID=UPI002F907F20
MHSEDEDVYELSSLMTPWVLRTAVTIDLPALLEEGPRSTAELAALTRSDPSTLTRIVRYLACTGFVKENPEGQVALTGLGRRLCSSVDPLLSLLLKADSAAGRIDASLATLPSALAQGQVGYARLFGKDFYQDVASDPELSRSWNELMADGAPSIVEEILQHVAFDASSHVIDVGGGTGHLVAGVTQKYRDIFGCVLELPYAAAAASALFAELQLTGRCRVQEGSFFDDLPEGDTYFLASVLHEWPDGDALKILRRCAEAMPAHGRVIIVDRIVDSGKGDDALVANLDIMMLTATGGRERTREEIANLVESAGMQVQKQTVLASGRFLVEAGRAK